MSVIDLLKRSQRLTTFFACLLVAVFTVEDARALPATAAVLQSGSERAITTGGGSGGGDDATLVEQRFVVIRAATAEPMPPPLAVAEQADIGIERQRRSVVEDWSSVCKHLCRTGLGGTGCGAHCEEPLTVIDLPPLMVVSNAFLAMCPILCSNQLGYPRCHCATRRKNYSFNIDVGVRDDICAFGCAINSPLVGCSQCLHDGHVKDTSEPGRTTQMGDNPVITNATESISTTTYTVDESDPTPLTSDDGGMSPTITTSTTTTTTTTTVKTTSTTKAPTTPNWYEHCQNLCRIGEGGSLCNCDMPPFF